MKGVLLLSAVAIGYVLGAATSRTLKKDGLFRVIENSKSEDNALEIEVTPTNGPWTHGFLGMSLPNAVDNWAYCERDDDDSGEVWACMQWGDYATVRLRGGKKDPDRCLRVEWESEYAREIQDCYNIDALTSWYAGPEQFWQVWPLNSRPRQESVYVPMDQMADTERMLGGVLEKYWLLSNGAALIIDDDTPLHYSVDSVVPGKVCFTARDEAPYSKRRPLTMAYEWCTGEDVKEVQQFMRNTFFEKPPTIPDEDMMIRPLWSTWAPYKDKINQSIVLEYARKVVSEGFGSSSHIEVDDRWESCYGEAEFDPVKFPDPKGMIEEIRAMGMRTTAWIHPFLNYDCPKFQEAFDKGYLVKTPRGKPGLSWWWTLPRESHSTGVIDITNPEARDWFVGRLKKTMEENGLSGYKFDAGEIIWLPSSPVFAEEKTSLWPTLFTQRYVETVAPFGIMSETRVAHQNQKHSFFVRMMDKDSAWGYNNGLQSMIPTLFTIGMVGYPFVLPDMIGGNAYGAYPSKELYIRWMQVNIFMPSVQFSIAPWEFDSETVQICLKVLAEREKFRDEIVAAARQAVVDGTPINRPIWWVSPKDTNTFSIDDEYMLGDNILVAPVVKEGAVSRDIYLPAGNWTSATDNNVYEGEQWLQGYPAPLDVVPYFIRKE